MYKVALEQPLSKRILAQLKRVVGVFPLTWAGVLVIAGCVLAFTHYGLGRIDLILLGVGAVGIGIAGLSLLLSCLAALLVYLRSTGREEGEAMRLECGYWTYTGFSLSSMWYIPFVHLSWRWLTPEAEVRVVRRWGEVHEQIRPDRRGTASAVVRRVTVSDIFGLTRISFSITERRSVRFLPWVGALRQMHVVRGMSGGDEISHHDGEPKGDRFDTRHYVPGDPIRFVLWKVFAKSRELIVRTPERAISPARQTMAYLVAGEGDEAAAGAARVAVDVGVLGGDWVLGADGCGDMAADKEHALELLAQSASASEGQSGGGLSDFLDKSTAGKASRAVVFVPPRPGPWLKKVVAVAGTASGQMGRVDFVVGTDGISRGARRSLFSRLTTWSKPRDPDEGTVAADADELAQVVRALGGARVNVLVVDRPKGQIYTHQSFAGGS